MLRSIVFVEGKISTDYDTMQYGGIGTFTIEAKKRNMKSSVQTQSLTRSHYGRTRKKKKRTVGMKIVGNK